MIQLTFFRTPKRCWQRIDGVSVEPGSGSRQWVLSRALCHFSIFELEPGLPPGKRMGALRIKLAEWAPFEETGTLISWSGSQALVWAWDKAQVDSAIRSNGFDPRRVAVVPETTIATPADDGIRLRQALDGVEGEAWLDGRLVASRWWAQVPSAASWITFLRSSGFQGQISDPSALSPVVVPWLVQPWATQAGFGDAMLGRFSPKQIAAAAALVLALPLLYQGSQLARLWKEQIRIEGALARAQTAAMPISTDRAAAMEAIACSDTIAKLEPYPSQLHLLARVAEQIPNPTIALSDWSFQSGDLRFTVSHQGQFDAAAFLRAFSAQPDFERVTGSATNDKSYAMNARVRPRVAEAGQ